MKSIAFVIPYYGKFPLYFEYFLKSCENNASIEWLIFTDIKTDEIYPSNVHHIEMTFEELRAYVQNGFDFEISLDTPYKLCDFKPAYGYIFREYLQNYDFWGYCDADVIFGDIRKFIPDAYLDEYDKIGHLGHMSIFKNDSECNMMFMKSPSYQHILSHKEIFIFDEWGKDNINSTFIENGCNVCFWNEFADIYPYDDNFRRVVSKCLNNGARIICESSIEKATGFGIWKDKRTYYVLNNKKNFMQQEVAYIHFQKRMMPIRQKQFTDDILCTPNGFLENNKENYSKELKWVHIHKYFNYKKFYHIYGAAKYWLIEKSGPIRHGLRRIRRKG